MSAVLIAIAMLMISGAAAIGALAAARMGGFERLLLALAQRSQRDLEAHMEHLVHVATIARRDGLLVIERHAGLRHQALLRRGICMALEGQTPAAIRLNLGGTTSPAEAPVCWSAPRDLVRDAQCASIALTAGVLVALLSIIVAGGSIAPPGAAIAWFSICAAMITLAISSLAAEPVSAGSAHLLDAMQIETAALIAAGRDPQAVRSALLAMIRPAEVVRLTRAA